jgi:hypothetical protein
VVKWKKPLRQQRKVLMPPLKVLADAAVVPEEADVALARVVQVSSIKHFQKHV